MGSLKSKIVEEKKEKLLAHSGPSQCYPYLGRVSEASCFCSTKVHFFFAGEKSKKMCKNMTKSVCDILSTWLIKNIIFTENKMLKLWIGCDIFRTWSTKMIIDLSFPKHVMDCDNHLFSKGWTEYINSLEYNKLSLWLN